MKNVAVIFALFLYSVVTYGSNVDSITVDSVWNSDSSWYDNNGVLHQRPARDCFISFIPRGTGTAYCSLSVSFNGGNTWGANPDSLRMLDKCQNSIFLCGQKGIFKIRISGEDRQNVVFKVLATTCPSQPKMPLLNEGFEVNLSNYNLLVYTPDQGFMSLSKQFAHSGTGSLTSDSNNTSIKARIEPPIDDSIAGLQFYLMATKAAHTNFLVALCRPGSSANGLFTIIGMGFDKSDSLKCFYQEMPSDDVESKNFAALTLDKWYKCKIEYDFTDTTLTYYLNDAIVHKRPAPNPITLPTFVVMRDNFGAQGSSGYYLDDVTVYKK